MKISKRKWTIGFGATILALALVAFLFAPLLARLYLNHFILKDMGDYTGHVSDIDLSLFKGSYVLQDMVIHRKGGNENVPFFAVEDFWVSISWEAIRNGALRVQARLDKAQLNFLDARLQKNRQSGAGTNWLDVFESLIPTTLHRLEVTDGAVSFKNFDTEPKVDLSATEINGAITNLTNVKDQHGKRVASGELTGVVFDGAQYEGSAKFDPFDYNDFEFAASLKNVELTALNNFSKAYGNIDFEDGDGDIFAEITAENGELKGYIKPLFSDVNIMSWQQDVKEQGDNPLQILWESSLGFIKTLLTNSNTDQVATQLEISGSLSDAKFSSWQAVGSLVKNAFIDSLDNRYEKYTSITEQKQTGK